MAEKKVVEKKEKVVVEKKVENSPEALKLQAVFDAYAERNPGKAKAKAAEFEEKLAALNK